MVLEDIFSKRKSNMPWISKLIFFLAAGRILILILMKVIYKLYEIRTEKGISLRELEQLSGIGKTTINRIESGNGNPTVEVICQLAVALNCSPYDLFYMVT